jgi:hypothetical protein
MDTAGEKDGAFTVITVDMDHFIMASMVVGKEQDRVIVGILVGTDGNRKINT